ncbi:ATP-binding protein [Streptacidiphilus sp. MAP12-33]|uniref:ATP-binding protein n=1 Tax=Streptacidiphilus sp. MAP12-33 TaxID=3156266 RepID=UPI003515E543
MARCRVFVRHCLEDGGWPDKLDGEERRQAVEEVLLLASEIATNACLHADGPRRLTVSGSGTTVRVEVADGSALLPVLRPEGGVPCGDGRFGGHGMRIVDRLTRGRWGSEAHGTGKTVWFELVRPEPSWTGLDRPMRSHGPASGTPA